MELIGYPLNIILCNTRGSSVAANLHVAFLCLKGRPKQKQKNQAGLFAFRKRLVFYRFTLQVNLGDKSGAV